MKLINWRELSRVITGNDMNIRSTQIPSRHKGAIKELTDFIESWIEKYKH